MQLLPSLLPLALLAGSLAAQSFANFESPQVHPIDLSPDGTRLFVVNTPDHRVAVFSVANPRKPVLLREVPVGLEPVSVRARTADEVWVVNWLSDSVSVVSVPLGVVLATIQLADEPADVVFAQGKAFVSVSGADQVLVFDATTRKALGAIDVFGDEPRSLCASADGKTVWAAVHRSGNETTVLPFDVAPAQPAATKPSLPAPPAAALIVHSEDPTWRSKHDVVLPDHDLVEIDVATASIRKNHTGLGTIHFAAAVRPGTAEVWIANTEARNVVRFVENLRGHAWDNRVTRVDTGSGGAQAFDLNPGLDYQTLPNTTALSTALAQPTDLVWDATGKTLYVAAFGTDRIGVLDATGKVLERIEVGQSPGPKVDPRSKRGPRGLALHAGGVLFVSNRLANSITGIDTGTRQVLWEIAMADPTPAPIRQGRGFLYDAKLSGNGTFACASCHVDGDLDGLAWDLGDRAGSMFTARFLNISIPLHPMKGAMTTQTLKGLRGAGPFHWRGDKPKLQDFNGAFAELMGGSQLTAADMDAYVAFLESITYPPNPNQTLERKLATQSARDGENLYTNVPFTSTIRCIDCHTLPTGTNGAVNPASLLQSAEGMKVSQLRNLYKRVGFRKTAQGRKAGFGIRHEGAVEDTAHLLAEPVFGTLSKNPVNQVKLMDFVEAFDTGTAPAVGHQVTVHAGNAADPGVLAAVQLLQTRAEAGDIDLIGKGTLRGIQVGLLYQIVQKVYDLDSAGRAPMTWAQLEPHLKAGRATLTLTGVPPGVGYRMALDRDLDAVRDGDEGVAAYGIGSAGCNGTPSLAANSEPRIGNAWFGLVGSDATSGARGVLGLGFGKASIPVLGVQVLVDVTNPATLYAHVAADAAGGLTLPLPLPHDVLLVGLASYLQVVWTDACAPQGLSATQGLAVTITR